MQYCDVITNPRWWTAAILNIAKSPYLSEKSSDFDKIWYTTADIERNDSHVTRKKLQSNTPLGVYSNTVIDTLTVDGCYIWNSEEGPGRAVAPPSPLVALPNVTAHHQLPVYQLHIRCGTIIASEF